MSDKPNMASQYKASSSNRAERVLLEIWSHLGDYHEHLVLIGGLAPRYLIPQDVAGIPTHCGTFDVDLAINLAVADVEAYRSIRESLRRIGFERDTNAGGRKRLHSFVMQADGQPVILDFLTTKYDGPSALVRSVTDELSAIQVEGLGLALRNPQEVLIEGQSLHGGIVPARLRVCRPVPYVVLKALAFDNRGDGKDAYDLVYVLRYIDGGPEALSRLADDEERGADSFIKATGLLGKHFASTRHNGPVRYGRFLDGSDDAAAQAFAAVQEFLAALRAR